MLSRLYGKITDFRNSLYEKNLKKSYSLGAKTVSVGNITVGGTGKTPLVAFIAEIFAADGEKVCILTRGYGRENPKSRVLVADGEKILAKDARQAGDEPFELAQKLSGRAVIVADADRVSAANWAREKFGVTVFVLDDAFQHRRAKRDLDIVCIDATNPFGNSKVLPTGILREPLKNLNRADLIVITRANLAENLDELKNKIRQFNDKCPIFAAKNTVSNLSEIYVFSSKTRDKSSETEPQKGIEEIKNKKFLAFCALGNPENFFEQMRRENFRIVAAEAFSDHYFYRQTDVENLEKKAAQSGAEALLTTAKDAVKLKDLRFKIPCFVAETEMRFDEEKLFRETIQSVLLQ
jgi:tetraacyldisaccharide 4'-kinase